MDWFAILPGLHGKQCFSTGGDFAPRRLLAMSGDIFGSHEHVGRSDTGM